MRGSPLRSLVLLVGAVVLVDTSFYAVITPLLPHYADDLGLTKPQAGILAGAYAAGTLLGAIPCGILAARRDPRLALLCGLGLLALASVTFGFAHHILLLDTARFVQGIGGAASWAGALGWLLAVAPADRRGALIGTALAAAVAGSLLGPVLGTLAEQTSTRAVFSSVVLIAGVLAVIALRFPGPPARLDGGRLRDLTAALARTDVRTGMWLVVVPALAFGALNTLVPLRFDRFGAGAAAIGATFLVAAIIEAGVSPVVGRLSDRHGRLVPIRAGLTASAVLLALVTLPGGVVGLAVLVVLTTGALGAFWAPAMALLSDAAEAARLSQALALALTNLAWGAGQVGGAAAGGRLAASTGDGVPLALLAVVCLTTLAVLTRPARRVAAATT